MGKYTTYTAQAEYSVPAYKITEAQTPTAEIPVGPFSPFGGSTQSIPLSGLDSIASYLSAPSFVVTRMKFRRGSCPNANGGFYIVIEDGQTVNEFCGPRLQSQSLGVPYNQNELASVGLDPYQ